MDLSEGMVAVVRGLPDAALAVSLLDGGRQYTLVPNAALQSPAPAYVQPTTKPMQVRSASTEMCPEPRLQGASCHSGAQAVDGRYASNYKMSHCNVQPTSPPVLLTEFPPQRAELCRGHGNFEVGGLGSGEIDHVALRANGTFRGVMNWPDRGAVFLPKPSYEPDAFAQSLRRYRNLPLERSAEMIERLVNYTQMKNNYSRVKSRSATHSECNSAQGCERRSCIASLKPQRVDEPEVNVRHMVPDDSPTRDTAKKYEYESGDVRQSVFGRNYNVRYFRDSRRAKENLKNVFSNPDPGCPVIKENSDHLQPENQLPILKTVVSVNMETQAEIPMTSREVATTQREHPSTRNVAVPLSPSSSRSDSPNTKCEVQIKCSCKSIQTSEPVDLSIHERNSVQTCVSSIDVTPGSKKLKSFRKSKSQEELRINDDLEEELLQLLKDLNIGSGVNLEGGTRNELLRKLRKLRNTDRSDRPKAKFGRSIKDQLYSQIELKSFTRELSNELISKIKANNMFVGTCSPSKVLERDNIGPSKSHDKDNYCVDELITKWLEDIPIKVLDYSGRHVKKENVRRTVAGKIKSLIVNKVNHDCYSSLKPELFDILEDIPIEVNARNKMFYLNRIVNDLVRKIENICAINAKDRKRWKRAIDVDKTLRNNLRKESFSYKHIQPTENELKQFVKQELDNFMTKFHLKICSATEEQIQMELIDILIDSTEAIRFGNDEQVKEEILIMLSDLIVISEHEGIDFVNSLTHNLKELFKESVLDNSMQQTFVVLQNTVQNTSMQTQNHTADFSIEGITDQDIQNNLDLYTKEIVQQINEWIINIQALSGIDASFKQDVVNELARDIVDRHKYLELSPDNKNEDGSDLEHLKFQIFKLVNKLIGKDNLEAIEQASQLMQRIQSIPVPMLTRPILNINTNLPTYSEKNIGTRMVNVKDDNQSENRRFSSAGEYAFERPGSSKECTSRQFNEHRRHSGPGAILNGTAPQCCTEKVQTCQVGEMSDPTQNKVTFTETDIGPISRTHLRNTSINTMEPPTETFNYRRHSGTAECPSGRQTSVESSPGQNQETTTTSQLNNEYDQYLQNWVQQIPIITSNPGEQGLIEKMRLGIYNGIWKALTKLHMNPTTLDNPFYYQDVLDDEIEELLDLLPQSKELTNQKQMLKAQLIEKTTNMNRQIFNTSASSSYKQQLIDNISNNLPRKALGFAGSDLVKICEEIHKLNLAETYIMITMYKDLDIVKANVYKKKLLKQLQEFFDTLKRSHGIDAKDIDFKTYKEDIMNAILRVPLPSDDTIREEGDEVLIGLEIEQWFSDLPLYQPDNFLEVLCRKRYRDTLAKRIHDMEKQMNLDDCEDELRHEIMRFMGKLPLRSEDIENIPFMVEELVNRLKNRPKDLIAGSERRNVSFIDPHDYDEFSRHMQLCSSFSDEPGAKRAQINESSYMIAGGEKVNTSYAYGGQNIATHRYPPIPESPQEWLSLFPDSNVPSALKETVQGQGFQDGNASGRTRMNSFQATGGHMMNPHQTSGGHMINPHQVSGSHIINPHKALGIMSPSQPSAGQIVSPRRTSGGQMMSPCQALGGRMINAPQASGGHITMRPGRGVSFDGQSHLSQDFNYQQPMAENMQRQESQRFEQSPYSSLPQDHTCGTCHRKTSVLPGQDNAYQRSSRMEAPDSFPENGTYSGFPRTQGSHRGSSCCSPERSTAPTTGVRPEISPRPYKTSQSPAPSSGPQGTEQASEMPYGQSPSDFSRDPIGFSTPQQNGPPPRESRPKKRRSRDMDRSKRDGARRRLDLSDSDDSIKEEMKCRCMERVCKCRMKRSYRFPCEECGMEFPSYFPRGCPPFAYYF